MDDDPTPSQVQFQMLRSSTGGTRSMLSGRSNSSSGPHGMRSPRKESGGNSIGNTALNNNNSPSVSRAGNESPPVTRTGPSKSNGQPTQPNWVGKPILRREKSGDSNSSVIQPREPPSFPHLTHTTSVPNFNNNHNNNNYNNNNNNNNNNSGAISPREVEPTFNPIRPRKSSSRTAINVVNSNSSLNHVYNTFFSVLYPILLSSFYIIFSYLFIYQRSSSFKYLTPSLRCF
jgi:hypothetical protein